MSDRGYSNFPERREIETQLHTRLEAAKAKYESASDQYKHAIKRCDELRMKSVSGDGDGSSQPTAEMSVSKALKAQHDAFDFHRQALEEFNKFILYGECPERLE